MAQQMEEVDNREVDVEACGVEKYKASKGFKKGLAKLGHNSFTFNYKLVISKATYDHLSIELPKDPIDKCSTNSKVVIVDSSDIDD